MADLPETVVQLIPSPWTVRRLQPELLRSEPDELIEVRVCIDGVDHDYRVVACKRWLQPGRGQYVVLSVEEVNPELDLVRLEAVEG